MAQSWERRVSSSDIFRRTMTIRCCWSISESARSCTLLQSLCLRRHQTAHGKHSGQASLLATVEQEPLLPRPTSNGCYQPKLLFCCDPRVQNNEPSVRAHPVTKKRRSPVRRF